MLRKSRDEYQENGKLKLLQDALVKLHNNIHDPASYKKWEDMEPKELLKEINLPNLQPGLEKNLEYWPKPIQDYFTKEVIASVRESADYDQKDLEIIYHYLETALIKLPDCAEGQFPTVQLERAMQAVSHELRRYYGREEDDEEFPCWPNQ